MFGLAPKFQLNLRGISSVYEAPRALFMVHGIHPACMDVKSPLVAGLILDLPQFTSLVSCSNVANHYSLNSMKHFFGYLHAVGH